MKRPGGVDAVHIFVPRYLWAVFLLLLYRNIKKVLRNLFFFLFVKYTFLQYNEHSPLQVSTVQLRGMKIERNWSRMFYFLLSSRGLLITVITLALFFLMCEVYFSLIQ